MLDHFVTRDRLDAAFLVPPLGLAASTEKEVVAGGQTGSLSRPL
jgi:hypothetical protein